METRTIEAFPVEFDFDGIHYSGEAVPLGRENAEGMPQKFNILLNKKIYFHVEYTPEGWKALEEGILPQYLAEAVGNFIFDYYE